MDANTEGPAVRVGSRIREQRVAKRLMSKHQPLLEGAAPANPLYPYPGELEEDANAREHEIAKLVRARSRVAGVWQWP